MDTVDITGRDFDSLLESLACDKLIVSDDVDLHSVYPNDISSFDLPLDDCSSMETTSPNWDDFLLFVFILPARNFGYVGFKDGRKSNASYV
jgi:hypothetical protein